MKIVFSPKEVEKIILAHANALTLETAEFNTVNMAYISFRDVEVSYEPPVQPELSNAAQ